MDYQLRASAWAVLGGPQFNALELDAELQKLARQIKKGGGLLVGPLWEFLETQGGYVPVPARACPQDQIFVASATFLVSTAGIVPGARSGYWSWFETLCNQWRNEVAQGSTLSLREYWSQEGVNFSR